MYKFDPRKVISARIENGMNQDAMASVLDMTRQTYMAKESGKRSFSTKDLEKIALATSKPVEYFFGVYVTGDTGKAPITHFK